MRAIPLMVLLLSCGDKDEDTGAEAEADADTDTDTDADSDADTDADTYDDGYDPEEESPYIALEPVAVDDNIYIANPDRNSLTRVSIADLSALTAEIGPNPAVMVASDPYGAVVILDTGLDEVHIVDATSLDLQAIPIRPHLNQLQLSPDGRWALCYYQSDAPADHDTSGAWSYSEVSVVDITTGVDWPQSVGFEPAQIQFSESGDAVLVSDAWLVHLDLRGDEPVLSRIQIEDTVDPPAAEEVLVTPDGAHAIVRQFGVSDLILVDLVTGETDILAAGDNPTDLDVTPDGAHAMAVARGSSEVWIYDLAAPEALPEVMPLPDSTVLGSINISDSGDTAILYSTAAGEPRFVSWDLNATDPEEAFTTHGTVKPIDGVFMAPGVRSALLVHPKEDHKEIDEDSLFAGSPAVTIVDLDDYFTNSLRLSAAPAGITFSDDGLYAFFYLEDLPYLESVDLEALLLDELGLLSNPAHVGVFPGSHTAYASQAHELGRLSFYNAQTEELQTITGFELNSSIDQ